jgi:tetratricopeptide (TPR) repeat protein
MLTPIEMLAKKNRLPTRMWLGLLLALFVAGCMPSGQRAVLRGKKLLDAGDYVGAVEQLRMATTMLPANAAAWNYLGVAYQKARQPGEAVNAYQRALTLNRDLVEAHWNLGMLYLEQNKNDLAQQEFTAYTLRRNNSPEGWLKLGAVQLRLGQAAQAERSFGAVQMLDRSNAEALNGLGLARLERKNPREAVQYFAYDNQIHPDYAPAILNLAVTAQQYLRDDRLALQYYHAYLALTPRPDNWDEVNVIVNTLEEGKFVAVVPPPAPPAEEVQSNATPPPAQVQTPPPAPVQPGANVVRRPTVAVTHPVQTARPVPAVRTNPAPVAARPPPTPAPLSAPQPMAAVAAPTAPSPDHPQVEPPPPGAVPEAKPGLWDKIKPAHWFAEQPLDEKYANGGAGPLPANSDADSHMNGASSPGSAAEPARPAKVAVPVFARYGYLAPARPRAGDRRAASGAFNKARIYEQGSHWMDAMQAYRTAAELDPSWFEAQYNFGVLSYRLGIHRQALGAYEMALAIQPDSVEARYNFALALKATGCVPDAINELKKVLATNPGDVQAHLTLANLYAQKMHDTVQARDHYIKVLDLDPANPQADDIRRWLSANSQ